MINWSTSDIAGIEFGDNYIAAARLRGNRHSLGLTHAGVVEYDSSSPTKIIAEGVRTLWRKTRMPTKTVCASLRSSSLVMRYFSMPPLSEPELKAALQIQAEEALQMGRDELVLEWHVFDRNSVQAAEGRISGVLAAAPARDVARELEVFHEAGLDPVLIDVRALAVANLHSILRAEDACSELCLINLAPHSADIVIQKGSGEIYPHTLYCRASTWEESPAFLIENIRDVLRYGEYKLGWPAVQQVVLMGQIPVDKSVLPAGAVATSDSLGFVQTIEAGLKVKVEYWNPIESLARKSRAVTELLDRDVTVSGLLAPVLGLASRRS